MPPSQILILRHAEKPGDKDDDNLSPKGYRRAGALAAAIPEWLGGDPHHVFAAAPSKHSVRSVETVTPLADSLSLAVDRRFAETDTAELASELARSSYADARVVVAWHHERLDELAEALGVSRPPKWKDSVFDRYWLITFASDGSATFADFPQQLLYGDSEK